MKATDILKTIKLISNGKLDAAEIVPAILQSGHHVDKEFKGDECEKIITTDNTYYLQNKREIYYDNVLETIKTAKKFQAILDERQQLQGGETDEQ